MLEWLSSLHSAEGISQLVGAGGVAAISFIIFAETGLLLGFFLPGDSLLITAGLLANPANPHFVSALQIVPLNFILIACALVGNQLGYGIGRRVGDRIWQKPDSRFFRRKNLESAHAFYEKYGGFAVVAGRFVPIFRTFVPFVAGVARMPRPRYIAWNILGGTAWVTSMLWIGYYLGQTSLANRLDKIIVLVLFVSVLPMGFAAFRRWCKARVRPTA